MIWLKNKDILTKNNIILPESSKNSFLSELKKVDSSILVSSEILLTNDRVSDSFDGMFFTKYYDTNISRCQYLVKKYRNKYPTSISVLESVDNDFEVDLGKFLDVFSYDYSVLCKISRSTDLAFKSFLTEKINSDFSFFIKEILPIMKIEKIKEYDIKKIEQIKELSSGLVDTNCDFYLDKALLADTNTKVLELAKKLR